MPKTWRLGEIPPDWEWEKGDLVEVRGIRYDPDPAQFDAKNKALWDAMWQELEPFMARAREKAEREGLI